MEFYARIIGEIFRFYKRGWVNEDIVNGRVIGRWNEYTVVKNHITGKKRSVPIWMYDGYGVQDIRTSIDWLCLEGKLPKLNGWR